MSVYRQQVHSATYNSSSYLTDGRLSTYFLLIKTVWQCRQGIHTVLEIGPGNKLVTDFLSGLGFLVETLDIDDSLKPNYCMSVTDLSVQRISKKFDLIIASQILEHIRFQDCIAVLKKLKGITNRLIITLPDTNSRAVFFSMMLKLPGGKRKTIYTKCRYHSVKHVFNGQHYWEIGKKGYRLSYVKKEIEDAGWYIEKNFLNPEYPYHRFFVLKAIEDIC